jgi:hypothetical protein
LSAIISHRCNAFITAEDSRLVPSYP